MGTITGTAILIRQRDLIQDVAGDRWQDPECLRWLNDGIRDLVTKVPSAYTLHAQMGLATIARQRITFAGAFGVVDVPHNADSNGNPGRAIRKASAAELDLIDPDWRTATGDTVKHWVDDVEPHTFYVYPGKPKTSGLVRKVEVVYPAVPTELYTLSQQIPVDDIYANALGYYLAFRLYSKDSDSQASQAAASAYYTLFTNSLGA